MLSSLVSLACFEQGDPAVDGGVHGRADNVTVVVADAVSVPEKTSAAKTSSVCCRQWVMHPSKPVTVAVNLTV